MIELNKIYNEDCLETMKRMEDKSVDVIVTDFPYGNMTEYGVYVDTQENLSGLVSAALPEMLRVAERVIITPGNANQWLYPRPTWTMAWFSSAGIGSGPWGFSCWQPILCYGPDPYLSSGKGRRPDIFQSNESAGTSQHPCPKPPKLWASILNRVSVDSSDIIYDPFLGSGTTAVAAIQLGRQWIGSEINPDYCKIAQKRIDAVLAQGNLFDKGA